MNRMIKAACLVVALLLMALTLAGCKQPVDMYMTDGVDYRNPLPAEKPAGCFNINSGLTLTVCSDITFDNIILFQLGNQNTVRVQNGGNLVITDTVQLLSKPGLWLQKFTTQEPDAAIAEVAIASMQAVIPENKEDDIW